MPNNTTTAGAAAMNIAASALKAQQARMRVIAENIANSDSTAQTPQGNPYQRQTPVFQPAQVSGGEGVKMSKVVTDTSPFREEYQPGNPAAAANGYVKMPNVDPLVEAMDMRAAQRAYDANLNVIETARAMEMRTLDLIKK